MEQERILCTFVHSWVLISSSRNVIQSLTKELEGNVEGADMIIKTCQKSQRVIDIDAVDRLSGATPLLNAVMSLGQASKMVQRTHLFLVNLLCAQVGFLLDLHADGKKKLGHTPALHCAAWNGCANAVKELLGRNFQVNEKDGCGRTAFEVGFSNGFVHSSHTYGLYLS